MLLLSWPYRLLLKRNIVEHDVTIKKIVSIVPIRDGHLNENVSNETTSHVTQVPETTRIPQSYMLPLPEIHRSDLIPDAPPSYIDIVMEDIQHTNGQHDHRQEQEPPSYEDVVITSTTTTGL